ncbi:unnamed protein product [Parajaminaea phylloscopi]
MKRLALSGPPRSEHRGGSEPSASSKQSDTHGKDPLGINSISSSFKSRAVDKRAHSEQLSQLRALQDRKSRGLRLTEAEEVRLAGLMAQHKEHVLASKLLPGSKGKDDCSIM